MHIWSPKEFFNYISSFSEITGPLMYLADLQKRKKERKKKRKGERKEREKKNLTRIGLNTWLKAIRQFQAEGQIVLFCFFFLNILETGNDILYCTHFFKKKKLNVSV